MNTVTVRLVRKSNGKSAVYLAYGKPIILPDGSKRKSESLKIDIHTVPKNNAEMRYNDKAMEIVEYVRCNRQIEKIRNQFNMGHIDRMDDSFLDYIDEKVGSILTDLGYTKTRHHDKYVVTLFLFLALEKHPAILERRDASPLHGCYL